MTGTSHPMPGSEADGADTAPSGQRSFEPGTPRFSPEVAHPARVYNVWILRHEAPFNRTGVKDPCRRVVAAAW
jgi:hypothetical protein